MEAVETVRIDIETLLGLAAEPGDHARPDEYDDWGLSEGSEQNTERAARAADGLSQARAHAQLDVPLERA